MKKLDDAYLSLLQFGMTAMRLAVDAQDYKWIKAEFEFLHNVPSLIGAPNWNRHRYFWEKERPAYLTWLRSQDSERKTDLMALYEDSLTELSRIFEDN